MSPPPRAPGVLASDFCAAVYRGDMPAAVSLLTRSAALLPEHDPRRLELLPELAFALMETADFDRLVEVSRIMDDAVAATGDATLRAHASVVALRTRRPAGVV